MFTLLYLHKSLNMIIYENVCKWAETLRIGRRSCNVGSTDAGVSLYVSQTQRFLPDRSWTATLPSKQMINVQLMCVCLCVFVGGLNFSKTVAHAGLFTHIWTRARTQHSTAFRPLSKMKTRASALNDWEVTWGRRSLDWRVSPLKNESLVIHHLFDLPSDIIIRVEPSRYWSVYEIGVTTKRRITVGTFKQNRDFVFVTLAQT